MLKPARWPQARLQVYAEMLASKPFQPMYFIHIYRRKKIRTLWYHNKRLYLNKSFFYEIMNKPASYQRLAMKINYLVKNIV